MKRERLVEIKLGLLVEFLASFIVQTDEILETI